MTKCHRRIFLFLRVITTFFVLILILGFIHLRIDLYPNRISVDANLPDEYANVRIRLSDGGGFLQEPYFSGQILPKPLSQFDSLKLEIVRKPILNGTNFLLADYKFTRSIETTVWKTAIQANALMPPDTQGLILNPLCDDAQFTILVGTSEWPVKLYEPDQGSFIAQRPSNTPITSDPLQVTITNPEEQNFKDPRQVISCLDTITAIDTGQPLQITQIHLDKSFGRLGVTLPFTSLTADEIYTIFAPTDPDVNVWVENGILRIEPGNKLQVNLEYQGSLSVLTQEFSAEIFKYEVALYLVALFFSGVFYIVSGVALTRFVKVLPRIKQTLRTVFSKLKQPDQNLLVNKPIFIKYENLLPTILLLVIFVGALNTLPEKRWGLFSIFIFFVIWVIWAIISNKFSQSNALMWIKQTITDLKTQEYLMILILLVIGITTLFSNLGSLDFYEDEFQVIDAAGGFLKTSDYYRWDWANNTITTLGSHNSYAAKYYSRAWPHTFLVAQSFNIFGISEWSARVVSVLFGLVFFVELFFFARYFTNHRIALLAFFAAIFYPSYIGSFRYTRMYALLLPLFLSLAYTLFRAITGDCWPRTGIKKWDHLIGKYLNFDYRYAFLSLPLLIINYIIHVNSLVILLAVLVFVSLLALIEKKKKFIVLSIIGGTLAVFIIPIVIVVQSSGLIAFNYQFLPDFISYFSLIGQRNYPYLDFLLRYPFGIIAAISSIAAYIFSIFINKQSIDVVRKRLYLFVIFFVSAIFFVFFADRYIHFLYTAHITPIVLLIILDGFWNVGSGVFNFNKLKVAFSAMMIIIYFITVPAILFEGKLNFGNFSTAYQEIVERYNPDEEVIFGQYLRTYYLQKLEGMQDISLLKNKAYSFDQFITDLNQNPVGWLTWETRKSYHLDDRIIDFAEQYFQKLHGTGKDDTGVEVYYFSLPEGILLQSN